MSFSGNVKDKTVVTDEVVAVELYVQTYGRVFTGKGWAKKHPKDQPNAEVGLALAFSRALLDAAEQLTNYAEERIGQMAQPPFIWEREASWPALDLEEVS